MDKSVSNGTASLKKKRQHGSLRLGGGAPGPSSDTASRPQGAHASWMLAVVGGKEAPDSETSPLQEEDVRRPGAGDDQERNPRGRDKAGEATPTPHHWNEGLSVSPDMTSAAEGEREVNSWLNLID